MYRFAYLLGAAIVLLNSVCGCGDDQTDTHSENAMHAAFEDSFAASGSADSAPTELDAGPQSEADVDVTNPQNQDTSADAQTMDADLVDAESLDAWTLDAQILDGTIDSEINDAELQGTELPDAQATDTGVETEPEYTQAEIDYFLEVAMNIEFGGSGMQRVHKWMGDLNIEVHGDPTPVDLAELDLIVAELNELQSEVTLTVVPNNGNVDLYFSSIEAFRAVEPNYRDGNQGFFWTYWFAGAIVRANIFVHSMQADIYRRHLLREELTQSLGLMNDSYRYADSIFYAPWSDVTSFSAIDRTIIGMLYRANIDVNMDADDVLEVFDP